MLKIVKSSSLPLLTEDCPSDLEDRVLVKEFYAKAVKEFDGSEFSLDLSCLWDRMEEEVLRDVTEGVLLGTYVPKRYPAAEPKKWNIEFTGLPIEAEYVVKETETLMEGVCWARDLVNCPGNMLRPGDFAAQIQEKFKDLPAEVEILGEEKLKELGMNAILAVGSSSAFRPVLCIIRYKGNPDSDSLTALVGKGVTCDTGGYCIKRAESMTGIKGDMGGGAAVAGALYALARNRVKTNVVGLVPMVENRISNSSMLPGDVITAYNGMTIEILNTDAEGRLILADSVAYAVREEKADRVLDIATLTGAVCASLGFGAAGTLSDNEEFYRDFEAAFQRSGERYFRFPIYAEYEKMIESDIADVKNTGGKFAGTITAGLFIRKFADQLPWLHLDIAGTAWVNSPVFEYQSKGATGAGVTTMYYLCKGKRK